MTQTYTVCPLFGIQAATHLSNMLLLIHNPEYSHSTNEKKKKKPFFLIKNLSVMYKEVECHEVNMTSFQRG